jgi:pimeloyl-ACP methyl ester carboxylesterase
MNQAPLFEFGGSGPVINLSLANGFPPQTYQPVFEPLTRQYRVVCLLPRALWQNGALPQDMRSWHVLADDLLAGLRAHNLTEVIAVGHSVGAVVSMLAILAEPARFRALIMLDPAIMPPLVLGTIKVLRLLGLSEQFPLVKKARHRRRDFATVEAAYTYFKNKALFANWPDDSVQRYARSVTRPTGNGGGLTLAWSPDWEAQYFKTIYTGAWGAVRQLKGVLPVLVIRGSATDTFTRPAADFMRRLLPDVTCVEVAGHGHLFPQSAPVQTRQIIAGWLAGLKH